MISRKDRIASTILVSIIGIVMLVMAIQALDFMRYSKHFPLTFGVLGALLSAFIVIRDLRKLKSAPKEPDQEEDEDQPQGMLAGFFWIAAYLGAAPLVGFVAATGLFSLLFLRIRAKARWVVAIPYTICAIALVLALTTALNLDWPPNLIKSLIAG